MEKIDYTNVSRPMTKRDKEQWLNALRSGNYKQGKECLVHGEKEKVHCCLGVIRDEFKFNYPDNCAYLCIYDDKTDFLPLGVQETLAAMNDDGKSFNKIADYVEQNIPAIDE